VPVAAVAEAIWGERVPPGHAATIQTYVSHLRDLLEPGRDRGAPSRFLRTEAAVGLWRGEVLANLADYGFVGPLAVRLDELQWSAIEALMDVRLGIATAQCWSLDQ